MDWRIKGVTQKVIGVLPAGLQINDLMVVHAMSRRSYAISKGHVANRVRDDWVVLAGYMKELGLELAGMRYVEIGTGWLPILPICYSLAGAREVVSYDLIRHLNAHLTLQMLKLLDPFVPTIAEAAGRPISEVESTLGKLRESKTAEELA